MYPSFLWEEIKKKCFSNVWCKSYVSICYFFQDDERLFKKLPPPPAASEAGNQLVKKVAKELADVTAAAAQKERTLPFRSSKWPIYNLEMLR